MIQDKRIKIDKTVVANLTRRLFILSIVLMIIGAGLSAYSTYVIITRNETYVMIALVFGLIFLVAGIVVIARLLFISSEAKQNEMSYESTFEDTYMLVKTFKADKKIKEEKYPYNGMVYFKKLKDYLFVYVSVSLVVPVSKVIDGVDMLKFLKEEKNVRQK